MNKQPSTCQELVLYRNPSIRQGRPPGIKPLFLFDPNIPRLALFDDFKPSFEILPDFNIPGLSAEIMQFALEAYHFSCLRGPGVPIPETKTRPSLCYVQIDPWDIKKVYVGEGDTIHEKVFYDTESDSEEEESDSEDDGEFEVCRVN